MGTENTQDTISCSNRYKNEDDSEYSCLIDLLSSNTAASEAYLDMCGRLSTIRKVEMSANLLGKEVISIVSEIENKSNDIDSIIKTLYKVKEQLAECKEVTIHVNEDLDSLEEKLSSLKCEESNTC